MSLQAYQTASARTEAPRDTEYRLFGEVTRALIAASESSRYEFSKRIHALDWNRRMWTTLAQDCASPANQLPAQVRANIISLSIWVARHSSAVMRGEESFDDLIEINRMIMQALAARGAPPAAA